MTEHHDKSSDGDKLSSHEKSPDKPSSHDKSSSHEKSPDKPSSHDKSSSHEKSPDKPSSHDKSSSHEKSPDKPSSHDKSSSHEKSHDKLSVHHKSLPHSKDKETITLTKTMFWQILAAVFFALFLVSTSLLLTGNGFNLISSGDDDQPGPTAPLARVEVDIGDSPVLGSEDAPVTIIEFSDFECPYCASWYSETKGQLDEEYINSGKVKLVYMHYPLPFHPQAEPAALASECAYEQGKFWEFHDLIFENQRTLGEANYKKWAGELSLDQGQFDDCYDSEKYQARVQEDLSKARVAGVGGTPNFLVNGIRISGAQPFSVFQQVIDAELNS